MKRDNPFLVRELAKYVSPAKAAGRARNGFFHAERACQPFHPGRLGLWHPFSLLTKKEETMDDYTLKANYMHRDISNAESPGKKPWQTPALTEVDYSETRSGGSLFNDGGGLS